MKLNLNKTCMKWTKKGDYKTDKCYDHDHYFVCGHSDVNCKDHSGGNTVTVGGSGGTEDACPADKTCVNTDGGYRCENAQQCGEGYEYKNGGCRDINECTAVGEYGYSIHKCKTNTGAWCVNTDGSYHCACPDGYQLNFWTEEHPNERCLDINECNENNPKHDCDENATCSNTDGGFTCECKDGYSGNGKSCCGEGYEFKNGECRDVNECTAVGEYGYSLHKCKTNTGAWCVNTDGSYHCACPDGYTLNYWTEEHPNERCLDIDECRQDNPRHDCDENATCSNTDGGFTCACNTGYSGNGKSCNINCDEGLVEVNGECEDIDECDKVTGIADCGEYGVCQNTVGSFHCDCEQGYEMRVGESKCRDINECETGAHNCLESSGAVCVNQSGSFDCECPTGYRLRVKMSENYFINLEGNENVRYFPRSPGNNIKKVGKCQ